MGGMPDDPKQIANDLIREHGLNDALTRVMAETATAHYEQDNYALSVWREVKRILRERTESGE
jgi:hypothetical protein